MNQPVKTPSLGAFNNSLVVRSSRFDVDQHTELNTLYSMFKRDAFTTHLGMIHLWNQRKLMNTPLLNMTEARSNIMYVNGAEGKFRYGIPYEVDFPQIVEDMTGDTLYPGQDGEKFKIKLSEPFANTDIITTDWRDGIPLAVGPEEIYDDGGWVHTVTIPISLRKDLYYPKELLQSGTPYMKMTNYMGEFEQQKSSIRNRRGMMELEMQIGAGRSVSHWITGYADMLEVEDKNGTNYSWLNMYGDQTQKNAVLNVMDRDEHGNPLPKTNRWIRMIEAMLFAEIKVMEDRDLTWNKGGIVQGSGRREIKVNTGLYEQMRDGNRIGYDTLTLNVIEDALVNLYWNSGIPVEQRHTKFMVGTGAMIEISKLLGDDFNRNTPFHVLVGQNDALKNYVYGTDTMNLGYGYRFVSKRFPVGGTVEFEINPAFDNQYNRIQDGLIGEFPIESYSLAVFDVLDQKQTNIAAKSKMQDIRVEDGFNENANIVMIKPKNWGETYWGYEVGTFHPFGPKSSQGMFGASQKPGYGMWAQNWSSIWLKDAGRTILIEKNRKPIYY
jgi:hypothetical protein